MRAIAGQTARAQSGCTGRHCQPRNDINDISDISYISFISGISYSSDISDISGISYSSDINYSSTTVNKNVIARYSIWLAPNAKMASGSLPSASHHGC